MTQDRSTLAEQIAWLRRQIPPLPVGGNEERAYDDMQRDILATLEGMAAPGDSPSPQQPTQEDLDVARKLLANIRFVDDDEDPDPAIELIAAALQFERSADQRGTGAPVSGDARKMAQKIVPDGELARLAAQGIPPDAWRALEQHLRSEIEEALTAATDKARREALARLEDHYWDSFEWQKDLILAHVRGALSTPQNPGDAEAQEG